MQYADRPYHARRLAGVDQALGDGLAREPADLLDQLRERLDRLAANHPSAVADSGEPSEGEPAPETGESVQIIENPEISSPPDDPAETDGRSRSEDPGRAQRIAAERAEGVPAEIASLHAIDRPGGQPYRPWFASDESGDPWFVG